MSAFPLFLALLAESPEPESLGIWKLINFAIFAALLGYAMARLGPRFFNARSSDIQKAIKDATGLKIDADFRYSEMDKKMANLAGEVEKLRAEAASEMNRERERQRQQTAEESERIRKNTTAEIEALRAEGAAQVRQHTIELAFGLSERRLRDRLAQSEPDDLLQDFAGLVERGHN
jgi:F-type H+-transporting ATPase subunit b